MKKILLFATISLMTSTITSAQNNWSIGIRTGAEQLKYQTIGSEHNGIRLQEQVFITKRISKRFEIEGHFAYVNPYSYTSYSKYINDGPNVLVENITTTDYNFGINAKYYFIQKPTWSVYGNIGALANKTHSTKTSYNDGYISWGGYYPEAYNTYKYNAFSIFNQIVFGAGINKNICEHFYFNAQFLLGCDPSLSSAQSMGNENTFIPKLQLGLAYAL